MKTANRTLSTPKRTRPSTNGMRTKTRKAAAEASKGEKMFCAEKEQIVVCFAVNNGYAPYLGIVLASLVEHAGAREYELVILYRDLNERHRELLQGIVDQFSKKIAGSFHLRFFEVPENVTNYDFSSGYKPLAIETWYRLFVPSFFPKYDKILWLDADILIRADVAELYTTDMGDNWIAACRWDYGIIGILEGERRRKSTKMKSYFTKTLGIKKPKEDYVNSGVLLLNLRAMREQNVQEKLLEAARNHDMHFHDQCVINMVCHEHIYYLDSIWNGLAGFNMDLLPKRYREKALYDERHRKIIHWAGLYKPWREPWCKAATDWWNMARRTPYYEEILYTNICTILRGEMNKKISEQGSRLADFGKSLTELGRNLVQ